MNEPDIEMELTNAVENCDVDEVRRLLEVHPQFINHDYGMGTWLHMAARENEVKMIEMLAELGCDVNAEMNNSSRDTPLFCAITKDNPAIVRALLEHGADPNQGRRVITAITGSKKHALEMVKLLEKHGADLHRVYDFAEDKRINALSAAIQWEKKDVADYLRARGAVMPDDPPPAVAPTGVNEVIDYFTANFGQVSPLAVFEIVPTGVPISVHIIPVTETNNLLTLFTTGLSDRPMTVPAGNEQYQFAELFIQLPGDWKYNEFRDPKYGWPFDCLRRLAQQPHQENTWIGGAVVIMENETPQRSIAPGVPFTSILLMAEKSFVSQKGHTIQLYRVTPLYSEESELERRAGLPALMLAFDRHSIPFVVDVNRPNVATL